MHGGLLLFLLINLRPLLLLLIPILIHVVLLYIIPSTIFIITCRVRNLLLFVVLQEKLAKFLGSFLLAGTTWRRVVRVLSTRGLFMILRSILLAGTTWRRAVSVLSPRGPVRVLRGREPAVHSLAQSMEDSHEEHCLVVVIQV